MAIAGGVNCGAQGYQKGAVNFRPAFSKRSTSKPQQHANLPLWSPHGGLGGKREKRKSAGIVNELCHTGQLVYSRLMDSVRWLDNLDTVHYKVDHVT